MQGARNTPVLPSPFWRARCRKRSQPFPSPQVRLGPGNEVVPRIRQGSCPDRQPKTFRENRLLYTMKCTSPAPSRSMQNPRVLIPFPEVRICGLGCHHLLWHTLTPAQPSSMWTRLLAGLIPLRVQTSEMVEPLTGAHLSGVMRRTCVVRSAGDPQPTATAKSLI